MTCASLHETSACNFHAEITVLSMKVFDVDEFLLEILLFL